MLSAAENLRWFLNLWSTLELSPAMNRMMDCVVFLFLFLNLVARCSSFKPLHQINAVTATPPENPASVANATRLLQKRATVTELSTCGYGKGDPDRPRTANSGYNCRIDVQNGLWGFCPTTVLTASDCGLAGSCFDDHDCFTGCGLTDRPDLTTFSWYVLVSVWDCEYFVYWQSMELPGGLTVTDI